jgi:hypothetical protein
MAEAGRKELEQMAEIPSLQIAPATKSNILAALENAISDRADVETAADDLFVFHFSGHGMTLLSDQNSETVFATEETVVDQLAATAVRSSELIHLLRQIPGQKLVILDACRSLESATAGFDPGRVKMQFEQVMDVHFFFSSDLGEVSYEVGGLAFDRKRPVVRQGNSLFTYSLLYGLNNPNAAAPVSSEWGTIKIRGLAEYLETRFFNLNDPDNAVGRLKAERNWPYVPTPQFILARDPQATRSSGRCGSPIEAHGAEATNETSGGLTCRRSRAANSASYAALCRSPRRL